VSGLDDKYVTITSKGRRSRSVARPITIPTIQVIGGKGARGVIGISTEFGTEKKGHNYDRRNTLHSNLGFESGG